MAVNNPYIEKVKADKHILTDVEKIYSHKWKWDTYFGNTNPLVLEIGTGMGNFFGKQVEQYPDKNFLGMEIRYKRLYSSAEKARENSSEENFVLLKDFGEHIDKIFEEWEIDESYIFFPDPWARKDRQKKHRLMQAPFIENLYNRTKAWGRLIFKSDHREYFDSSVEIIEEQWLWNIVTHVHDYENSEHFDMDNITSFEAMYRWEKKEINYLVLEK